MFSGKCLKGLVLKGIFPFTKFMVLEESLNNHDTDLLHFIIYI